MKPIVAFAFVVTAPLLCGVEAGGGRVTADSAVAAEPMMPWQLEHQAEVIADAIVDGTVAGAGPGRLGLRVVAVHKGALGAATLTTDDVVPDHGCIRQERPVRATAQFAQGSAALVYLSRIEGRWQLIHIAKPPDAAFMQRLRRFLAVLDARDAAAMGQLLAATEGGVDQPAFWALSYREDASIAAPALRTALRRQLEQSQQALAERGVAPLQLPAVLLLRLGDPRDLELALAAASALPPGTRAGLIETLLGEGGLPSQPAPPALLEYVQRQLADREVRDDDYAYRTHLLLAVRTSPEQYVDVLVRELRAAGVSHEAVSILTVVGRALRVLTAEQRDRLRASLLADLEAIEPGAEPTDAQLTYLRQVRMCLAPGELRGALAAQWSKLVESSRRGPAWFARELGLD